LRGAGSRDAAKILSSAGLFFDLIGASMLAVEVFRRFRGIRFGAPQTYAELTSAPKESDESETWEQTNFRFHFWVSFFLLLVFFFNWHAIGRVNLMRF
jgi:hypothetical protein